MSSKIGVWVYVIINFLFILTVYLYPISRDDFFYFDKTVNPITESITSYLTWNPRFGQFICNIIERIPFLVVLYAILLFNGFFYSFFLLVKRRKFCLNKDAGLLVTFVFLFFVVLNYYGEMFYYKPYSTNYVFPTILYLLYTFVFIEALIYRKDILTNIPLWVVILFGIITGMGNEYIPPVLIVFSFLVISFLKYKEKKIRLKETTLLISIITGFVFLYFAPANEMRALKSDSSLIVSDFSVFLSRFVNIVKIYIYYNKLILILLSVNVFIIVKSIVRSGFDDFVLRSSCLLFIALFVLGLCLFTPLVGTRLFFFSNTLIVISTFISILNFFKKYNVKVEIYNIIISTTCVLFFIVNLVIVKGASDNSKSVFNDIKSKALVSKDVKVSKGFNFYQPNFSFLNRAIFLDKGDEYIDRDPNNDTSQERNVKEYFKLNSLSKE